MRLCNVLWRSFWKVSVLLQFYIRLHHQLLSPTFRQVEGRWRRCNVLFLKELLVESYYLVTPDKSTGVVRGEKCIVWGSIRVLDVDASRCWNWATYTPSQTRFLNRLYFIARILGGNNKFSTPRGTGYVKIRENTGS